MDDAFELQRARDLFDAGELAAAAQTCQRLVELCPADAQAWFMLGAARHRLGELAPALDAFERVVQIDPGSVEALSAKASVLSALGQPQRALEALRQAQALAPDDAQLLTNIGICLEQIGEAQAALSSYDAALTRSRDCYPARLNRGALLLRMRRFDEALTNNDALVRLHPNAAAAHFNRAESLLALDRCEDALAACAAALDLAPDHVEAHIDRGLALAALGRIEQAEQAFARAGAIDPRRVAAYVNAVDSESGSTTDRFDARVIYLVHGFERIERCDWRDFDRYVTEFDRLIRSSAAGGAPLDNRTLAHHALIVPVPDSSRLLLARAVAARIASEAPAAARSTRSVRTSTRSGGRLNIGYISPDFRNHPSAYLTRSVYALHDRDGFRVHCYSLTGDDGSAVRREIESACDAFRDVTSLGADEAARAITQDGIDILVDLAGYTRNSRTEILALRPAPVQVSYLGFCGTMGADFIDYAVVDRTVCPAGSEANWHERLVFMPESYYVAGGAPRAGSTMPSRADAGLPERGFVFCCFNNAFKIEPSIFGVWMRLLRDVPGSVLWLLASNPAAVANLRREAEARGVAGERLVFAPFVEHDRHIARIGLADLVLDTLWYNAHTTAVDALWAGVPVVTCPGRSMAARVGASLLHAVGLPEMIAADVEEYERTARQLAAAPDRLVKLRHKLRANRTVGTAGTVAPLFDVERWVRHIEDAFRRMWVLHAAGEPAQSFAVARRPA